MFDIYCIKNKVNKKVYIGLTIQGARTRFLHHVYEANSGSSFPIHRAIRKYGKESFELSILETCSDKDYLKQREIFWISELKSMDREFGYNITSGWDGTLDRKHSEETKKKIGLKAKNRKASSETRNRMSESHKNRQYSESQLNSIKRANEKRTKQVLQYDLNMNFICEYKSMKEAAEKTGMHYSSISGCIKRNSEFPGINQKFVWKLK